MDVPLERSLLSIADGDNPLLDDVQLFIVQLVFILLASKALGYLFRYIKQPQVVAEIITGILIGPTVLGHIPGYTENLFTETSLTIMNVFANIGLIFFMFLIGIELDPGLLRKNAKQALIIAFASMAAPFGIGALFSILLYHTYLNDSEVKFSTFLLFVAVAMSITAFPVLARILTETRLTGEKVGLIALSAAAVNDVVAWILLAVVVSIAKSKSSLSTLWTLLLMIGFFLLMAFGVRPLLNKFNIAAERSAHIRHQMVVVVLLLILISSWFTSAIGIHPIFGGFVMGVICPRDRGFALYITERIEDVVVILLLPLYFTISGLKTNISDLNTGKTWGITVLLIVLACAGKILGSLAATKLLGNSWRESITVGILMNTKGLVELIVLNLGLSVGVLTPELFAMFVMMAVVTTMLTSPLLHVIWIRDQARRAAPLLHENFSVLMCISNQTAGLAMASIAGTLAVQKKKKFSLQALHVTEVTDNPSSYIFSHRKNTPAFVEPIKERTRALEITLKFKQIFAVNVSADIDHYCQQRNFNFILITWNEPLLISGGSKIKQVLAHTPSVVGVLINKGLHEVVRIHKVLVIYTGLPHQKDALKIARIMCRKEGVQVTLLSSIPAQDVGISEAEPIVVIHSEQPFVDGIDESKKKYDLVVVGIAREYNEHEHSVHATHDLLTFTPASVLLVHPKLEHTNIKRSTSGHIFLGDPRFLGKNRSRSKLAIREDDDPTPLGILAYTTEKHFEVDSSVEMGPVRRNPRHSSDDSLISGPFGASQTSSISEHDSPVVDTRATQTFPLRSGKQDWNESPSPPTLSVNIGASNVPAIPPPPHTPRSSAVLRNSSFISTSPTASPPLPISAQMSPPRPSTPTTDEDLI